jgi:MFS family permease
LKPNGRIRALRKSTEQRNYIVGVFNGAFTQLGMNLAHPSLVLSVFIRVLGGSNTLIGLLPTIRFGGWFLPQFFVAPWIQPQQRKVPIAVGLEVFRVVAYALLGALCYTLGPSRPQLLLVLFFVLFSLTRLTAGTGALARTDAIGKVIPPHRRASFFALRNFTGGVLIFGAGFFIRYVLDEDHGQPFPLNFALFFLLSALFFLLALVFFSRVKEQPGPADSPHHSLREQILRGPSLFRGDPAFRRYIWVRVLQNMVRLASPFYPIFALDILAAPESMVGFYLSAMTLARIFSNPLWQWIGRKRGNFFLTKVAALLTALEPVLAVALPWGLRLAGLTVENNGLLPAYLFTLVFLVSGSSMSGRSIGFMALLLDLSPENERASYIGFVNTVLGVSTILTILAGAVIDWIGFAPIFWTSAVLLVLGYLATLGWQDGVKSPIMKGDPVIEEFVRPDRM